MPVNTVCAAFVLVVVTETVLIMTSNVAAAIAGQDDGTIGVALAVRGIVHRTM